MDQVTGCPTLNLNLIKCQTPVRSLRQHNPHVKGTPNLPPPSKALVSRLANRSQPLDRNHLWLRRISHRSLGES